MSVRDLERLLDRDVAAEQAREAGAFRAVAGDRPVVLVGAGGLGQRILGGGRVKPVAFVDNAPARQGTSMGGVPVLSAADAAARYGKEAAFVVSIWGANRPHRFAHTRAQLQALGCDVVVPFPLLCWAHPEGILPHYLQDLPHKVLLERDLVRAAYDVWADDASRAQYVSQVRLRLDADFDQLSSPVEHPQYFPDDLFTWRDDEWVVDGGAYNGDTVRLIARRYDARFGHLLALEPDPANFQALQRTIAALPERARARCDARAIALASAPGTLTFAATGNASAAAVDPATDGALTVQTERLDTLVAGAPVSFLKLDIEGAEPDALQGAEQTIRTHAPVLAICVYHLQNHLWQIPLLLRKWRDDYAFHLRPHNEEGWDLVCYAIPRSRLTGGAA